MKKKSRKTAKKPAARARKAPAKKKVAAIPPGYHTITPYLVCRGASAAIEFYKKALGAKEKVRMGGPDGKVMHAEIQIGNSMVMLGDEAPQTGASAPPTLGGSSVGIFIYTEDVDKAYARAIAAGATAEQPPTDMFWGDRYCKFGDPFGHKWSMATHTEDVPPKEMGRRMAEAAAQGANQT
jgi:PhnB protein